MTTKPALEPAKLRRICNLKLLDFDTTAELSTLEETVGQKRALGALRFGIGIEHEGYNLYALGSQGVGKHPMVREALERHAGTLPTPPDWCYINNFDNPQKPLALRMPPGMSVGLKRDMNALIQTLRTAIPATFESDAYRARVNEIEEEFKQQQEDAFAEIQKEAQEKSMAILHTPHGFGVAPLKNGEVISPDDFKKLSDEDKKSIEHTVNDLKEKLTKVLMLAPEREKQRKTKAEQLNREFALAAIRVPIEELRERYSRLSEVIAYLEHVQTDILENLSEFGDHQSRQPNPLGLPTSASDFFKRYQVNIMVDQDQAKGVPVIFEDSPSFHNLIGRVEYTSQLGALVTDFTHIRPGALHRANAGYLILEVRKLLIEPYAWQGLKRALSAGKITLESLGQMLGLVSTASLEPQAIPLQLKVVLLGDHFLYYLLCALEPDFKELFKVTAEFEDDIKRNDENIPLYARLIATVVSQRGLLPFTREAVAHVIDHSARLSGDAEKLSIHRREVGDLLTESDYWAKQTDNEVVELDHVKKAIEQKIHRADLIREKIYENIQRETLMISTEGKQIGQVNGLAVLQTGDFTFGQPSRITATVRVGKGEIIDIQREAELGGAIHSKGVLILASFLGARYAAGLPMSLSASLVFEQTYGIVEGDSASVAELCALLSALAKVPIKQSLALTGSVNQHGQVQAIGGVNEKIEGFFDICKGRGLSRDQGVLIPSANQKHLMLREDVVKAVGVGDFYVYAIDTLDQALTLLTGMPAGEPDTDGVFPPGSFNARVHERLREYNETQREFISSEKGKGDG